MALAHRRGGRLSWYTRDTRSVACSPDYGVHFGVNRLGFINVYAKDVALLPDWQQQIWAGFNTSPEGGVSNELLDAHVRGEPSRTQAPEAHLLEGLNYIDSVALKKLGFKLFRDHDMTPQLLDKSHRFRAVDIAGLYARAKDLARLTAERINAASLQKIVAPPKGQKWGSLKSLEMCWLLSWSLNWQED